MQRLRKITLRKLEPHNVLNVKINVTTEFQIRVAIAKILIKTAAWILGTGIKIEDIVDKGPN